MPEVVTWVSLAEKNLNGCDLFEACQQLVEDPTELQSLACCTGQCATGKCACR